MGTAASSLAVSAAASLGCAPVVVIYGAQHAELPQRASACQDGWAALGLASNDTGDRAPLLLLLLAHMESGLVSLGSSRRSCGGSATLPQAPRSVLRLVCRAWREAVDDAVVSLKPRELHPRALAASFPNLTQLDLSRVPFPRLPDLALFLALAPGLRSLRARDNGAGPHMAATLASALESRRCELTSLNLAENHIDDRGAARLAAALVNNGGTLEELLLRDNGISSGGAAALAGALSAPGCALRMLDLSSNADIGCDAALTLAAALSAAPPPPLRTLLLSGCCAMGDAGTRVLGDALPRCRQLQQLSLASCGVTDVGAVALALGLRNNTSLLRLELCGNPIGDDGATALADALEHNTTLTALDLFDTDMAERGALALARALARAPALEALRLDLTMLSDEAQREQVTELAGMRLQTSGARGPRRWRLQDGPPWRPGELGWLIEDRKLIVH